MLQKKQNSEKTSTTFKFQRDCKELFILGEFNNWTPEKMKKLKDNTFTKRYWLKNNALYQYLFFDQDANEYIVDSEADGTVPNTYGTHNSYVQV